MIGYDSYKHRKGSKVHVAVSRESLPLSIAVGPGDEHDVRRFREVMDGIGVKHGVGRPRTRPLEAYADSAYDSKHVRAYLRSRGIKANIPVNPRNSHKNRRERPYGLKGEAYKRMRSCVERFFAWLKSFRRITMRCERLRTTFTALIQIACILIHLRVVLQ